MTLPLVASGLRVSFGGVQALKDASVYIFPGNVVGLIGRNGSGKSTLFNCITGYCSPDQGTVTIGDNDLTGLAPHEIVRQGIARTFQTPRFDASTTVETAILCGSFHLVRSSFLASLVGLPFVWREEKELRGRVATILDSLELLQFADRPLSTLSMGQIRLVEVARCVAAGAKFMLLDEPAAGLTTDEQEALANQIRAVASLGVGVLLVEHNFDLIRRLCDNVVVLEEGGVICTGCPEVIARDPRVLNSYLGSVAREQKRTLTS